MRTLFILLITCAACSGAWDTNVWPSWTVQREGMTHAWQCYSALVERCVITWDSKKGFNGYKAGYPVGAGVNSPTAPTNTEWRSEYDLLSAYKSKSKEIVPYFVVQYTNAVELMNTQVKWYEHPDSEPVPFNLPDSTPATWSYTWNAEHYSLTGICATLEIPTNYFDYTPFRSLNQLGGRTNDLAAVGRAHGWTNENTLAGGTNTLPSGRTQWYTTDYGWNNLRRILGLLVVTELHAYYNQGGAANSKYATSDTTGTWYYASYSDAQATNYYFWINITDPAGRDSFFGSENYPPGKSAAAGRLETGANSYYTSLLTRWNIFHGDKGTNLGANVTWMVYAAYTNMYYGPAPGWGHSFSSDEWVAEWNVASNVSMNATNELWTQTHGDTSFGNQPFPVRPEIGESTTVGYDISGYIGLSRWQFSYTNAIE